MRHGTLHTYRYHKCRCDECRAANAASQREYVARIRERKDAAMVDPHSLRVPHGTSNAYCNHKCRCDECRAAWAAYMRARRAGATTTSVPPTPRAARSGHVGGVQRYVDGCRCDNCATVWRAHWAEYRANLRRLYRTRGVA